jgi:hypothetical protein
MYHGQGIREPPPVPNNEHVASSLIGFYYRHEDLPISTAVACAGGAWGVRCGHTPCFGNQHAGGLQAVPLVGTGSGELGRLVRVVDRLPAFAVAYLLSFHRLRAGGLSPIAGFDVVGGHDVGMAGKPAPLTEEAVAGASVTAGYMAAGGARPRSVPGRHLNQSRLVAEILPEPGPAGSADLPVQPGLGPNVASWLLDCAFGCAGHGWDIEVFKNDGGVAVGEHPGGFVGAIGPLANLVDAQLDQRTLIDLVPSRMLPAAAVGSVARAADETGPSSYGHPPVVSARVEASLAGQGPLEVNPAALLTGSQRRRHVRLAVRGSSGHRDTTINAHDAGFRSLANLGGLVLDHQPVPAEIVDAHDEVADESVSRQRTVVADPDRAEVTDSSD